MQPGPDAAQELTPSLKRFIEVFTTVRGELADAEPVDKLIYQGAIPSMLRGLDPHTQFFDPGQFQQLKQMEESEQKGFGSVVSVLPGQVILFANAAGNSLEPSGHPAWRRAHRSQQLCHS